MSRFFARTVSCIRIRQFAYPEQEDIPLPERCRRVNELCHSLGKNNVIHISIHVNEAGHGERWMDATGWCAFTTRGDTRADALVTCLYEAVSHHLPDKRLRTDYTDEDSDIESDFYILRHTACPAVLTETSVWMPSPTTTSSLPKKANNRLLTFMWKG